MYACTCTYTFILLLLAFLFLSFSPSVPGPVVGVAYTSSSDGSLLSVSFSSTNQPHSNGIIRNITVSLVLYTGRGSVQSSTVNASMDNLVLFTALSEFKI